VAVAYRKKNGKILKGSAARGGGWLFPECEASAWEKHLKMGLGRWNNPGGKFKGEMTIGMLGYH
jgi:hypothetical protein